MFFNSAHKGGKHRKQSPNKGHVAMVAVTTGAVSTASLSGIATGELAGGKADADNVHFKFAANSDELTTGTGATGEAAAQEPAPQILALAEYKPVDNLTDQLSKAVEHSAEVAKADLAARMPKVVKPAEGTFTSGFGMRWGAAHNGVDIANVNGTPIVAVEDGVVIDSGPAQGFGNWIRIRHEDGSVSVYGHMESLDVAVGDHVTAGQKIAGMGSMGFSTGSHLHFEIHPDGVNPVDPAPWLAERGISL